MKSKFALHIKICFLIFSCFTQDAFAQEKNQTPFVVPFLMYTPDARAAAMGDAGVALSPDGHASSINAAKLPFLTYSSGISLSYNPWLKNLDADIHLSYVSGYYRLNDRNTIAAAIRYFSLGEVSLTDLNQQSLGIYHPNEFAIDGSFSRKFGPNFSLATTLRYISSQLMSEDLISYGRARANTALATDVSAYYKWNARLFQNDVIIGTGVNVSNIGYKISSAGTSPYLLPANMKIGTALTFLLAEKDRFSLAMDFNKVYHHNNALAIRNMQLGLGFEYLYKAAFALRAGYSYENPAVINQSYFSVGTGFNYEGVGINVAYIAANQDKNPLANSLRFSLHLNFNALPD